MRNTMFVAAALLAASCAAYDGYNLRPGESSEADVRGVMGAPAMEFANPDGSRRLVYPRGPLGVQTYMADIRPDGRVLSVSNALKDETFYNIRPGMTKEEILRLIGPPGDTMGYPLSHTHSWDYRYIDTWGYRAIFSVTFDAQDVVVSKFTQRIERERGLR